MYDHLHIDLLKSYIAVFSNNNFLGNQIIIWECFSYFDQVK